MKKMFQITTEWSWILCGPRDPLLSIHILSPIFTPFALQATTFELQATLGQIHTRWPQNDHEHYKVKGTPNIRFTVSQILMKYNPYWNTSKPRNDLEYYEV